MTARALVEIIEALPADKRAEVENFVQLVARRPTDNGGKAVPPGLVQRLRDRRERLLREHGLYETLPIIRELRDSGGRTSR